MKKWKSMLIAGTVAVSLAGTGLAAYVTAAGAQQAQPSGDRRG
ncbi:hypothetical protein [Brevibacillus sedimenti]|nr:hypothetical protein [Anoxybacillus sediminis]